jgi:hypothetical protein
MRIPSGEIRLQPDEGAQQLVGPAESIGITLFDRSSQRPAGWLAVAGCAEDDKGIS